MNKIKKIYTTFLLLLFAVNLLPSMKCFAQADPPELTAAGACVLDGDTGQVIYGKNIDERYYPASTTKVLTALVVLEHANLDDEVVVGKNPPNAGGTAVGIRATETYTVRDLLLGLLLMSGNDCANALAEFVSGSVEEFTALMNEKAASLGCTNSHFANPSGLPDENHYTTPRDLATIMKACNHNEDFVKIARTDGHTLPASSIDGNTIPISNHNYVLFSYYPRYFYEYSVASKKGYTVAAQFTNIISAKKDDTTLIGSFLKDADINTTYEDVHKIFDYGFSNFERQTLYSKEDEIGDFNIGDNTFYLTPSEDVYYTCDISKKDNLEKKIEYEIPEDIDKCSFCAGDSIATATVYVNDEKVSSVSLLSSDDYTYNDEESNINLKDRNIHLFIAILLGLVFMAAMKLLYDKKLIILIAKISKKIEKK